MDYDPGTYILVGQTPVREPDVLMWAAWFEHNERRVRLTRVGPYEISTVFLGLDHNHMRHFGGGPPLLFETMVFLPEMVSELEWEGRSMGKYRESLDTCERCSTWLEAEAQHEREVQALLAAEPGDEVIQLWPAPILEEQKL